jgi:NNP family nitrate/nitrite transporter-like MFS transporter
LLYIGTFGSFIGFSFAFGQVLQISFAEGGQSAGQAALHAAQIAFIGPLLGSVARIYGGRFGRRSTGVGPGSCLDRPLTLIRCRRLGSRQAATA